MRGMYFVFHFSETRSKSQIKREVTIVQNQKTNAYQRLPIELRMTATKPLKTFLGCASTRTGTLVAGAGGIILAIIGIVIIFTTRVEFKTIVLDWLDKDIVRIIITINFCMAILISVLLIVGTCMRKAFLMLPWVVLAIMLAIGLLVSVLYTGIQFYINGQALEGTLWIVLGIISVVIYIYMWLVVYSYFNFLWEETKRGAYVKDPFRRHY